MTKEEAKHLSNIAKAYSEGKTIERTSICYGNQVWVSVDIKEAIKLIMMGYNNVRVKPTIKYVPYSTVEEFLKDQKEHGPYFIYEDEVRLATKIKVHNNTLICFGDGWQTTSDILNTKYKWQDGTPCGTRTEVI